MNEEKRMKGFLCQLYRTSSNQVFTSIFIVSACARTVRIFRVQGLK